MHASAWIRFAELPSRSGPHIQWFTRMALHVITPKAVVQRARRRNGTLWHYRKGVTSSSRITGPIIRHCGSLTLTELIRISHITSYAHLGFGALCKCALVVPTFNRNDAHSFIVTLPVDRSEQVAIACALTDVDAELAILERRLVKARVVKTGMMQELLTGRTRLPSPEVAVMSDVGQIERKTQDRVVRLFREHAGLRLPRQLGVPRGQLQRRGRAARRRTCEARGYDDNLINKADRPAARATPRSAAVATSTRPTATSTACCATA